MERVTGKRLAVWGTGGVCRALLESWPDCLPDFFIDSDEAKVGEKLQGRVIFSPSALQGRTDCFIIVATDAYVPIRRRLEKLGFQEKKNFIWYREWIFDKLGKDPLKEAEAFLRGIPEKSGKYQNVKLIFSDFLEFDKGVCDFVNRRAVPASEWLLLSEAGWVWDEVAMGKVQLPVIKLPVLLAHNLYARNVASFRLPKDAKQYVHGKEYLRLAAKGLRGAYPDMAVGYEYAVCLYADKIIRSIIECWRPSLIALWNSFYPFHAIIRAIGEEEKIPLRYMEFGNIPGTIIVEELGQLGESIPARYPEKFLEIPVSAAEYRRVKKHIEDLRLSGLNRNIQRTGNGLVEIAKRLKPNRPIVFYAGQNDFASGLQPYTENSRKFHSPVFQSSDEAANFLEGICEKNDWNLVYKPHPMMLMCTDSGNLPDNVIYIEEGNINAIIDASDVVVTILSSVSYIALIREKPVVMLGYTQLKGTGCTYEAFEVENIEPKMNNALQWGCGKKEKENFIRHIVQLRKYYQH